MTWPLHAVVVSLILGRQLLAQMLEKTRMGKLACSTYIASRNHYAYTRHSLTCLAVMAAMLKPPIQPAEFIGEAKGNDNNGRVPANFCPFYTSHGI